MLSFISGKSLPSALRSVLHFGFDFMPHMTNHLNAVSLYTLFISLMQIEGPLEQGNFQRKRDSFDFKPESGRTFDLYCLGGSSVNILVNILELSLFNENVIK